MTHITPAVAAWYYSIPVGTIHYWASVDHWAKYGTRRGRRYDTDEVQASYERRRVPPEVLDSLTCGQAKFMTIPTMGHPTTSLAASHKPRNGQV